MNLKGKTAVITGSSGRLGRFITEALGQAGCNCLCHYHQNRQRTEQLVRRIKKLDVKAVAVQADLTKPHNIENMFSKAKELGTPKILINSAAVFTRQRLSAVTFDEAQKVLNLNLTAAILTSKAFAEGIDKKFPDAHNPVGKIINISDICGTRPWAGYVLYCSSKAGLTGTTKALAKELAPAICVNSIAPGIVTWPSDFSEAEKQRQLSLIPLGRIARPKEIADAIMFILESDYITGQMLCVDGGRCI